MPSRDYSNHPVRCVALRGEMFHRVLSAQGMQLVSKAARALKVSDWTPSQIEPEGLRYVTSIAVAGHWFVIAVCLVELVYRPYYGLPRFAVYALLCASRIRRAGRHAAPPRRS